MQKSNLTNRKRIICRSIYNSPKLGDFFLHVFMCMIVNKFIGAQTGKLASFQQWAKSNFYDYHKPYLWIICYTFRLVHFLTLCFLKVCFLFQRIVIKKKKNPSTNYFSLTLFLKQINTSSIDRSLNQIPPVILTIRKLQRQRGK